MSNPFPSDSSLASITEQLAQAGTIALRRMSIKNVVSYIFRAHSAESPSSTPDNGSAASSPNRTPLASSGSSVSTLDECPPPPRKASPPQKAQSPRARRQRLQTELRHLRESHLGLRLALVLPEQLHADPAGSAPPEHGRPLVTPHREWVVDDAIPLLDLGAATEQLSDGAEETPNEVPSDEAVRLRGREWPRSGSALAGFAGRCVAPRDLLFG